MMTRDEAEAAARKGAKVRHESWRPEFWATIIDNMVVWQDGYKNTGVCFSGFAEYHGWSIVEPAPTPDPGTVLPLSGCQPGWLVKAQDGSIYITPIKNAWAGVTLLSAAPGWTPVGEGDPQIGAMVQLCWQSGNVSTGPLKADSLAYHGAIFWRDASHDAQAPVDNLCPTCDGKGVVTTAPVESDLAARVAVSVFDEPATAPNRDSLDDLAARVAALESAQNDRTQVTFRTSRKPAPVTDDEIVAACWAMTDAHDDPDSMMRKAIALTRQSVLAQLAANEERAVEAGKSAWKNRRWGMAEGHVDDMIRAALAAIREGV